MSKHNKKRNIGIIYELLLKHMSHCLIENRISDLRKTTKIFEKRFAKGTEIYKEFRLFNALAKTTVSNTHIVASILSEAKLAARNSNVKKLDREKSLLIKDINHIINDKKFYYRSIENYKDLGTIQLTINEWRKGRNSDIKKLIEFENKVGQLLLSKKSNSTLKEEIERLDKTDSDKLVFKIMSEKINKKYSNVLSFDEKEIIKNYVLYSNNKNYSVLESYLKKKKNEVLNLLDLFESKETNKILLEKVGGVRGQISALDTKKINDDTIVKFLTLAKLVSELKS